jgi:hypothetical protein
MSLAQSLGRGGNGTVTSLEPLSGCGPRCDGFVTRV